MKASDTKKTTAKKTTAKKTNTKKTTVKKVSTKKANPKNATQKELLAETKSNLKTNSKCASCQDEMTDAFIQEVTEDVKNDNLKAFWNKYGLYIVLFVVLAISTAVGFETIKSWRNKQLQDRTEAYISTMIQSGNYEDSIKALEKIASGNYGIYSQLARIQIADILFEQNKNVDALNMLQAVINNEKLNSRVRNLATLKLASYKIDSAPADEIKSLLNPIIEDKNAWSPLAQEMLAMLAIKEGNFDRARNIYNEMLQNENLSENFKNRIQDMLSALSDM